MFLCIKRMYNSMVKSLKKGPRKPRKCRKRHSQHTLGLFVFFWCFLGFFFFVFFDETPTITTFLGSQKTRFPEFPKIPKHSHRKIHLLKCTHLWMKSGFRGPPEKHRFWGVFYTMIHVSYTINTY